MIDAAGRALYGARYKGALAEALGIGMRRIHRMAAGEIPIDDSVRRQIRELLRRRYIEITTLLDEEFNGT